VNPIKRFLISSPISFLDIDGLWHEEEVKKKVGGFMGS
jgi:hypothetical protein